MHTTGVVGKKRVKSFTNGCLILASAGMVSKLLGAIYRIPLTNILGAEGIGLYQLIFPIYALMLTLSSSAIPTAISRLVSERRALKDDNGGLKIVKASVIVLVTLGAIATFIMLLLSKPIATLQGNEIIKFGYYAIAPAIFIVACSAFFKGWFQGNLNMTPSALAQIVEQFAKMIFGLILAKMFLKNGLIQAVVGALIGLTLAELTSLIVLAVMYVINKPKNQLKVKFEFGYAKEVLKVSLPIVLSGLIFPLLQFVDSMLIVNILAFFGADRGLATADYGLLTGAVNSLINMPVVVTLALAVAIVPIIAEKRAERNAFSIKQKASFALKLSYLIAVPCFFGACILARPIIMAIYPGLSTSQIDTTIKLLQVSSVSIVLLSSLQIYTSLLQAMGKSSAPIINLSVAAVVKVALNIILLRFMGILGAAIASVVAYLVAMALNSIYFKKLLGSNKKLLKSVSKIAVISVIMAVIVLTLTTIIKNIYLNILVSSVVGAIAYGIMVIATRVLNTDELLGFPFGRGLAKLTKKIFKDKNKGEL